MNGFWKRNWWKYLLFVATLVTYGNLYGSWWSVIPGVLVLFWWIELAKKSDYERTIVIPGKSHMQIKVTGYSDAEIDALYRELEKP